jgi:hypothetical protein
MVINFPIESHHKPSTRRVHGLVPGGRQVNNCQAPEAQRNTRLCVCPSTGIVGAAVRDGKGHLTNNGLQITQYARAFD